ncbi:hypothetical protein Phi18:3_gp055 [Cellulophaga phage phi18:3]|uniref:Uncharacterized protein n=1 Tax=Cellulophaga phage phi18:3 TaxID=1327983 RepID=S0A282_9CAUD|nr:hypothetical protein Phi18:3_gp055 [Cellulophaga phage phi18:3]AGO48567.1 hypothetical protein Phi18:3_gp055 [Cellulophaga phage phi18:3]
MCLRVSDKQNPHIGQPLKTTTITLYLYRSLNSPII